MTIQIQNDTAKLELLIQAAWNSRSHYSHNDRGGGGAWRYACQEVFEAFGMKANEIKTRTIPKALFGTVVVNGVAWMMNPSTPIPTTLRWGRMRPQSTGKHRLFAACPCCLRYIPAGRLGQHAHWHQMEAGHFVLASAIKWPVAANEERAEVQEMLDRRFKAGTPVTEKDCYAIRKAGGRVSLQAKKNYDLFHGDTTPRWTDPAAWKESDPQG